MRLNAYVLAADPTWIQASVRSYYDLIETLVVCFDRNGRGWTGAEIPIQECLDRLKEIDHQGKIKYLEGDFARLDHPPMENDTFQRQKALEAASDGADWVLMFDTDELLPQHGVFLQGLAAVPGGYDVVYWPMRVLFQMLPDGRYLEVCTRYLRRQASEYPGPVAARPGTRLAVARHSQAPNYRFALRRPPLNRLRASSRVRAIIPAEAAIWHFSWVRGESELRTKLSSWGHNQEFDGEAYLRDTWRAARENWRDLRDFHPIQRGLWPALRPVSAPDKLVPPGTIRL